MVRKDFYVEVRKYIAVVEVVLSCLCYNTGFPLYPSEKVFFSFFTSFFPPQRIKGKTIALALWNLILGMSLFMVIVTEIQHVVNIVVFVKLIPPDNLVFTRDAQRLGMWRYTKIVLACLERSEASFGLHLLL